MQEFFSLYLHNLLETINGNIGSAQPEDLHSEIWTGDMRQETFVTQIRRSTGNLQSFEIRQQLQSAVQWDLVPVG